MTPVRLLENRVAFVTGGGIGFGRALALGLADAGAAVAVLGASGKEDATAREIEKIGGRAVSIAARFDTRATTATAFDDAARELGPPTLVVLAEIPAQALEARALVDVADVDWDATCEGPIRTALFSCQAAFAHLRESGGRIVVVSPTLSMGGAAGLVPYSAAAEAVRALAKSAARQWGEHGIMVNCLAPAIETLRDASGVATDGGAARTLTGAALGRSGDVRTDIAPVVALLGSDAAQFLTGQTLRVDGGTWLAG